MQVTKSESVRRLEEAIQGLLDNDTSPICTLTDLEKSALVVGLVLHRRQIKTEAVNTLIREFNSHMLSQKSSEVKKLAMEVDSILGKYDFNFKSSEIELEFSDSLVEEIKSKTRSIRVSNVKIQSRIKNLAKQVVSNLTSCLGYSPATEEEIQSELYEYLLNYGESKYDPRRSAYNTFAIMILSFRAKYLFKQYMTYYSKTQLTDFSYRETERDQEQRGIEKYKVDIGFGNVLSYSGSFSYMDLSETVRDPIFSQLSFDETRAAVLNTLSPLEKAMLYLIEFLRVPLETFPFCKKNAVEHVEDTRKHLVRQYG